MDHSDTVGGNVEDVHGLATSELRNRHDVGRGTSDVPSHDSFLRPLGWCVGARVRDELEIVDRCGERQATGTQPRTDEVKIMDEVGRSTTKVELLQRKAHRRPVRPWHPFPNRSNAEVASFDRRSSPWGRDKTELEVTELGRNTIDRARDLDRVSGDARLAARDERREKNSQRSPTCIGARAIAAA